MLAVAKFPEIAFCSSRVVRQADCGYDVDGSLTLRGTVRPASVTLAVAQMDDGTIRMSGHSQLRLTDYRLEKPLKV